MLKTFTLLFSSASTKVHVLLVIGLQEDLMLSYDIYSEILNSCESIKGVEAHSFYIIRKN